MTIQGYSGPAEDPVVTPDDLYFLFDSHTDDPSIPVRSYYATVIDYKTFAFQGEVQGINPPPGSSDITLDGAVDLSGRFYFTTSAITHTSPTIVTGRFEQGTVTSLSALSGVSPSQPGGFVLQVSISPDGSTLYYSDAGRMNANGAPGSSRIVVASRNGDGSFTRLSNSDALLANVNATGNLLYGAWTTADGLELFFTADDLSQPAYTGFAIYSTRRNATSEAFAAPVRVAAAGNHSENGNLSPDGKHFYFHTFVGPNGTEPTIYTSARP